MLVVLRLADPELEFHVVAWAVNGPVADEIDFFLVVLGIIIRAAPDAGETLVRKAAVFGCGCNQPVEIARILLIFRKLDLPVGVGIFREILHVDLVRLVVFVGLLITKVFKIGLGDGLTGCGIGDEILGAAVQHFLDDCGVGMPENHPRGVAVLHFGRH